MNESTAHSLGEGRAGASEGKLRSWLQGIFALLSFPMTYGRLKDAEPITIYDRAYRLRHNEGQNRVDRVTAYGAGTCLAGTPGAGIHTATELGGGVRLSPLPVDAARTQWSARSPVAPIGAALSGSSGARPCPSPSPSSSTSPPSSPARDSEGYRQLTGVLYMVRGDRGKKTCAH